MLLSLHSLSLANELRSKVRLASVKVGLAELPVQTSDDQAENEGSACGMKPSLDCAFLSVDL